MDHFREIKNSLSWHKEGKFEVELINGIITKLNFCEPGKGPEDSVKCLTSTDYKFLQSVYACLGDLFVFIEEENKRLGYRYAREVDVAPAYHEDNASSAYPMQSNNKIRPINDYTYQPEANELLTEDKELMREVG